MVFEGQGLHTAAPAIVRLARKSGPVVLVTKDGPIERAAFRVVDTTRSTTVAGPDGRGRVATVEHLFAALGALSIHEGIAIEIDGPEVPLLDGACGAWVAALQTLDVAASPSPKIVARAGEVVVGESTYAFEPRDEVAVEVHVDFGDARIANVARWDGDAFDFVARVARARTFGFEHEVAELLERGLAGHVAPESVVVIGRERILSAGMPFTSDEPARHKLLDLVGDLWVHGGPPRGLVRATRPGHAATHEAMVLAEKRGIVRDSA